MTRSWARSPTGEPLPSFNPLARPSIPDQRTGFTHGITQRNDRIDPLRSLNLNEVSSEPSRRSQLPFQPLYRDVTGLPPSVASMDDRMGLERPENRQGLVQCGLYQHPQERLQSQSQPVVISAASKGDSRAKTVRTAFRGMPPPDSLTPKVPRRQEIQENAKSSTTRGHQPEEVVSPVSTDKLLRSYVRPPALIGPSFGTYSATTLQAIAEPQQEPIRPPSQTFQIREFDKVTEYLTDRMYFLQQASLKAIAKAWIKAICPKKQARYPYSNKRKRAGTEPDSVPPWWPALRLCRHKEPDHIYGEERVNLLIHLLRLCPSAEDIEGWRGDDGEARYTSALRPCGEWTGSLKAVTPITIFSGITREPQSKVQRRPEVLHNIFSLAEMEEDFLVGGNDGNTTITWTPDPDARPKSKNPNLEQIQKTLANVYDADRSDDNVESESTIESIYTEPPKTVKRPKKNATTKKIAVVNKNPPAKDKEDSKVKTPVPRKKKGVCSTPSSLATEEIGGGRSDTAASEMQPVSALQGSKQGVDSLTDTPPSLTISFGSSSSADSGWSNKSQEPHRFVSFQAPSFDRNNFRQYDLTQVNSVYDMTHPQLAPSAMAQYSYRAALAPGGPDYSLPMPRGYEQYDGMEDLSGPPMLPYFNDSLCPTSTTQTALESQQPHVASATARPNIDMVLSTQQHPHSHSIDCKPHIPAHPEQGYSVTDARDLRAPFAMHDEPRWQSAWHPQWQRPHGLPVQEDMFGAFTNYESPDGTVH